MKEAGLVGDVLVATHLCMSNLSLESVTLKTFGVRTGFQEVVRFL